MNEKNRSSLLWILGGVTIGAVGWAVYKVLSYPVKEKEVRPEPARMPDSNRPAPGGPAKKKSPRFARKPPAAERDRTHKTHMNDHRPHMGNGTGERNQIGGRSSGKTARFQ